MDPKPFDDTVVGHDEITADTRPIATGAAFLPPAFSTAAPIPAPTEEPGAPLREPTVTAGSPGAPIEGELMARPAESAGVHPVLALKLRQRANGANWFNWIVGSSVINTILIFANAHVYFPLGLAFCYMVDVIHKERLASGGSPHYIAQLLLHGVPLGVLFLLGRMAARGQSWAFVVGTLFFLLDTWLFVSVGDWFGVGLHAWALFYIFTGWQASMQINRWKREAGIQL